MKKGSILIIVLWSLLFLAMLAVAIYAYARPQVDSAAKLINRARTYYLAKAGIARAIVEAEKGDKTDDYDALTDAWSDNAGAFKEIELGAGTFSMVNPASVSGYGLTDEERKININKASFDVLRRLFEAVAVAPENAAAAAAAVIDWRDEDDQSYMEEGAEDAYYTNLNPSYHCKNAKFDLPEELLLVRGVTPEVFDKIKDEVTVYTDGPVNINTAGETVLKSAGMEEALIRKIMNFRENGGAFQDPAAIAATLNASEEGLSGSESASISRIFGQGLLTVKSDVFSGEAVGRVKNRTDSLKITFIYDRNKKVMKYWREE